MFDAFKNWSALTVAVAAVAVFGVATVYMFRHTDSQNWERLVYLFGAVEALAFSAAGFLWGREVHREAATSAKDEAKKANDRADKLTEKAAAGQALAAIIRGKDSDGAPAVQTAGQPSYADLRAAADELFPRR
jgi:hypothetical protein